MSTQKTTPWIWFHGDWVPWQSATCHITAHGLNYGSSAFEGIRAYQGPRGPQLFRLGCHLQRLRSSARLMRMELPFDQQALTEACTGLVSRNRLGACYLRPLVYRDAGPLGLDGRKSPVRVAILAVEWGRYLGADAIEQGIDAMVSSWRRFSSGSMMPLAKVGGQYINNQLITMEANDHGFDEGIALDERGLVSEGAGENLFLVMGGQLVTPPMSSSILGGVTRDSVLTLAGELGITVRHESVSREMLYLADELFMTGTAAEITPVRSVDRLDVGSGRRGPITRLLQEEFFRIVSGRAPDRHGWLTSVHSNSSTVRTPSPAPSATAPETHTAPKDDSARHEPGTAAGSQLPSVGVETLTTLVTDPAHAPYTSAQDDDVMAAHDGFTLGIP